MAGGDADLEVKEEMCRGCWVSSLTSVRWNLKTWLSLPMSLGLDGKWRELRAALWWRCRKHDVLPAGALCT